MVKHSTGTNILINERTVFPQISALMSLITD